MKESTANLIDTEPMLVLGCSGKEMISLAGAGAVAGLVIGIILSIITGFWIFVLIPTILISAGTVYFGGKKLGKAKEGRPDGYFNRLLSTKLTKIGFSKNYVLRTGYWRVRR